MPHRLVESGADGLTHAGAHVAPDVVVAVIEHVLGDRHDAGDFLGVQLHVFPGHAGGLLVAGVTVHEIRHGQGAQDGDGTGLGAHVGQTPHKLHRDRVLGDRLKDLFGFLFRDQDFSAAAIDDCHDESLSFL